MDHHHSRPWTKALLSINLSCCEDCPTKLQDILPRMEGVEVVKVYLEENIVAVSGTMDPLILLNKVAKLGKRVKLLPNEKYIKNKKDHFQELDDERMENPMKDKASTSRNGQHPKHSSGPDFRQYKKEEVHKCENYVPPIIDEKVCRNIYCNDHPRGRSVLDRVPEDKSFFGSFGSSHSGCNGYCGGYPCYDLYRNQGGYHGGMTPFGYNGGPGMRPFGFM